MVTSSRMIKSEDSQNHKVCTAKNTTQSSRYIMKSCGFVIIAVVLLGSSTVADVVLRLPHIITSDMVLQAENPALFGWATAGANISVTLNDTTKVYTTTSATDGSWGPMLLDPRPASFQPVTIDILAANAEGSANVSLENILFGDVWVCSGQSNMEFSVAEMFERESVIAGAEIPGLRLFAVQKNESVHEIDDIIDSQYGSWVKSSPETICGSEYGKQAEFCMPHCGPSASVPSFKRNTWGYFSAVCFAYGRDLLKATGRPQGMLESCWGGTKIEKWSSQQALNECSQSKSPGDLWAGMIYPLLKFPIRGAIWYQGEANAGAAAEANLYYCRMKAMIQDWRAQWFQSHNMTFVLAQLAPSGDNSGGILRWSQLGAAALPGVGIGINIDLYDATSPCGSVHIRNKTVVAQRMALNALALSYNMNVNYKGPVVSTMQVKSPNQLVVGFTTADPPLRFVNIVNQTTDPSFQGFQVKLQNNTWVRATSAMVSGDTDIIVNVPSQPIAVRFAFGDVPVGQALHDASGLPSSPFFFTNCTSVSCVPAAYGQVDL